VSALTGNFELDLPLLTRLKSDAERAYQEALSVAPPSDPTVKRCRLAYVAAEQAWWDAYPKRYVERAED
jgi:hypothetical protein